MSTAEQTKLTADQLYQDPRIAQARQLVLEALSEHTSKINSVLPADPALQDSYDKMLAEYGQMRGGNLYFPYLGSGIGNGPFVELADGSVKLDFITGIGVHGFGHSDPRIVSAGFDAALNDTVMQGNLQQGTISYDFVKTMLGIANESGAGLDHCFLSTSGAMANENALKMAFQKHHPATRTISFERCFAGRTLSLAQVTDKAKYRDGLPKALDVDLIPFFDHADPEGSTRRSVQSLRHHANRFPGQHANFWMELVQGEGGYYPGTKEYFRAVIGEAKKHDMAIIADEIQSFSRTTRPFAFQHFELDDLVDIVTVGKISQVCCTLYRDSYKPRPGLISQTFTGSSWAILAGKAIIDGLVEGGNFGPDGKNVQLHNYFVAGIQKIEEKHPGSVHGPYGIGGMVAFTPFTGKFEQARDLVGKMYDAGLMSFMAGANPARVRFLMPLGSVTEAHIDKALEIIEQAVAEMASAA
ncbi:MAG: aminotransferase class III-fold pyridoxal phosphate-dependent enzyme [Pirellulaceae bacterium]